MLTGDWPIRPQPAARLTLDLDICYLRQRYRWVNRLWNINVAGKRPYVASGNPGNPAKGESAFTGGSLASGLLRNDYRNDYRVASRNQSRQSEAKSSQCSCPEGAPGLSIIEGNPLVLSLAFDKLRFSGETLGPGFGKGLVRTGNCSELRGSEQLTALGEWVRPSGPPSTGEVSERHFGVRPMVRAGAAADFPAGHRIVVFRYDALLPTIISSLFSVEELEEMKPRIDSRLVDGMTVNWQAVIPPNYRDQRRKN